MRISEPLGLAQPDPVDDGRVVESIGQYGVFRAQQLFEEAGVGVEATRVEDGVVPLMEFGDLVLQGLKKRKSG